MEKYNTTNPYFANGTENEQDLLEALTIESIAIKVDTFQGLLLLRIILLEKIDYNNSTISNPLKCIL